MNSATITGRLTKDVEVRKTTSGLSVAQFAVAVDNGKDKPADFINCVAWRQSAEFLGQYAGKGDMVGVSGRITTRNYERDGQRVYVTEITADRVEILAHKAATQQNDNFSAPVQNRAQTTQNRPVETHNNFGIPQFGEGINIGDDDLPF